ncbi:MAG: DUF805 domain-containing protein [Flavobacteriaceae bacterium]|nr:DUF805 domain-containing protein [Flavobacteriaceae bacterium]
MNWYLKVLKQYADFSGRARRKEYWMFTLFNMIFLYGLLLTGAALDSTALMILGGIYLLGVFIPSLAVGVRRMHDIGKSGWYILVSFIPFIGGIWLLILNVTDSESGTNKWGDNPKTGGDEINEIGVA